MAKGQVKSNKEARKPKKEKVKKEKVKKEKVKVTKEEPGRQEAKKTGRSFTEIRTSDLTFGTSFRRPRYGVDFDVVYSRFRNSIIDILYDNPFRFTDSADHPLRSSRVISADSSASIIRRV